MSSSLRIVFIVIIIRGLLLQCVVCHHSHDHAGALSQSELEHVALHSSEWSSGTQDFANMAPEELRFLYFQMHDSDKNNRLDGCELVKSLLHFHSEEDQSEHKISMSNEDLSHLVDPILDADDSNADGYIDYTEFVAAQVKRGL